MFVVVLTYTQPLALVDPLVPEHLAFLQRRYASGHFVLSGRQVPRTGGVILAKAGSRAELDVILAEDPFHREKVADYQVIEFTPSMAAAALVYLKEA